MLQKLLRSSKLFLKIVNMIVLTSSFTLSESKYGVSLIVSEQRVVRREGIVRRLSSPGRIKLTKI